MQEAAECVELVNIGSLGSSEDCSVVMGCKEEELTARRTLVWPPDSDCCPRYERLASLLGAVCSSLARTAPAHRPQELPAFPY